MNQEPGNASEGVPEATVREAAPGLPKVHITTATVLILAVWIGLIAGFLDLGLMVIHRRLFDKDFYRLGYNFVWLIPVGVTVLVLVPASVLALIARIRGDSVGLGAVVGLLSFVGFLDMSARLPLAMGAAILLSGGLATQLARLVSHRQAYLQFVRRTVPVLAGLLLTITVGTIGGRAWAEYRAMTALPPPRPGAKNVLLIVWDTVRAANLSLYGYGRPTTPNLERLASRGTRFDLAFSTSSWTLPSHASMFTGQWPHEVDADWKWPMRDDVPTLAEYLAAQGYDTAGFVANLDYCSRETGLARGFAHYEDYPIDMLDVFARYVALGHRMDVAEACALGSILEKFFGRSSNLVPASKEHLKNAAAVDRAFLGWLSRRETSRRPFFAFLNFNDAHSPYEVPDHSIPAFGLRPASSWDRLTLLRWHMLEKASLSYRDVRMAADIYDDCILYLDRRLDSLFQELERRGVLDDTLVIVTADHGEHLGDHLLFFHGCSLYRQVVHVPLVIVAPNVVPSGRVVTPPVSLRDLPATVVELLGLQRDAPFPGRSLARFWGRDQDPAGTLVDPLLMETTKPPLLTNQGREPAAKGTMISLVADGMHYIRNADGVEELYGLNPDPEERVDLAGSPDAREILRRFRNRLSAVLKKRSQKVSAARISPPLQFPIAHQGGTVVLN